MKKAFAVVMLVVMVVFVVATVVKAGDDSTSNDSISPVLPDKNANFQEVMKSGGQLISILFNFFAVFFVGMAGFAMVQLVGGHLQQNSMAVTHARAALTYSFIGLASLALIPKLAGIIISVFKFTQYQQPTTNSSSFVFKFLV
jgi:ABC-type cobalt transport system substrate-binding protein